MRRWIRKLFIIGLIGIPSLIIALGVGVTAVFGWSFLQQTLLLADSVLVPYKPAHIGYRKLPGFWPTLPEPGTKLGTIVIPAVNIKAPVVQGTTWDILKLGVGHYAGSPLPGQGGNVVFSGHRDTVFTNLKHVKVGDTVTFDSPYGPFVYRVTSIKIVPKTDPNIVVPSKSPELTLTSCYPFVYIGFAPDRFIVRATPVSEPSVTAGTRYRASERGRDNVKKSP
ncbi:MAG: class D sortase [Firmicutes bacterium]|jgi:sortase A|uniref:Class D sortase n=1 Tax=Sulfobacillus benefaciens TaxID=453960 RepID=A0A2T2WUF2_9FIRM|nr:class D sortase [Bacillota bacterium]PSR25864.1 MAG: class D sortase [Sulfobacillus benefaciens]